MLSLTSVLKLSSALGAGPLAGAACCRLRGAASATQGAQNQANPLPTSDALDHQFDRGDNEATGSLREAEYEALLAERRAAGLHGRPVDLETEFDRDNPEASDKGELWAERKAEPLLDVDLDTEMDRDDPLLADKRFLWDVPPPPPDVNLDTEMDRDDPLQADKTGLWESPEPPCPADIDAEMDMMQNGSAMLREYGQEGCDAPPPSSTAGGDNPAGTMAGNTAFGHGAARPPQEKPDPRIGQYREAQAT
ncbi:hypothetical protein D9Q98_007269 [Chlorella vulgaris]|uniref:Uncharacterized protein n=1 Tax=Chlorella vulgaris TaxID=3077 RepID=A0A9D4YVB7_CHLVU|nr:hypothetical protein D9Q98_007269 [Chlorella vulgaris]